MSPIRWSDLSPDARAQARKQLGMPVKRVRPRKVVQYAPTDLPAITVERMELMSIRTHLSVIAARIPQQSVERSVGEIRAIIDLLEAWHAQQAIESHSKVRR